MSKTKDEKKKATDSTKIDDASPAIVDVPDQKALNKVSECTSPYASSALSLKLTRTVGNISQKKVVELRQLLLDRGLPQKGRKAELIARLHAAMVEVSYNREIFN